MDWTLTIVALGGALWIAAGIAEVAFKIWLRVHMAHFADHLEDWQTRYNDEH